jgi:hypothetical protein
LNRACRDSGGECQGDRNSYSKRHERSSRPRSGRQIEPHG